MFGFLKSPENEESSLKKIVVLLKGSLLTFETVYRIFGKALYFGAPTEFHSRSSNGNKWGPLLDNISYVTADLHHRPSSLAWCQNR
jgi:hypothetical protein